MKEEIYMPGEILFKKGDSNNKLYYIVKGKLNLIVDKQN